MFTQAETRDGRRNAWLAVSFALHCLAVYFLVRPATPVILMPQAVMHGERGTSTSLIYVAAKIGLEDRQPTVADREQPRISLRAQPKRSRPAPQKLTKTAEVPTRERHAGSPYGSVIDGPMEGHDVRPALPFVFPDPAIRRSEIPDDVNGNVIVEVTIDAQGNVVETKVLQALGHGIEDKVIAALRNWRFRPATLDGVAVASRQDVYFHFPS